MAEPGDWAAPSTYQPTPSAWPTDGNSVLEPQLSLKPALRLQASMSLAEAGREVMSYHFGRLLANEAGTIIGSDPEALHDMRVATRRLRAAMRVFQDGFDRVTLGALAEEVSWLAGMLGRVRDLDVFLIWLAEYKAGSDSERAGVDLATAAVGAARAREREELLAALRSERYAQFKRSFISILQPAQLPVGDPGESQPSTDGGGQALSNFATRTICRQLRIVRKRARRANANDLERLHRLRIAAKRLRYACEFFVNLFPNRLQELIDVLVQVQDTLGGMRDAHLQRQLVRDLVTAGSLDRKSQRGLARLRRALRQRERHQYQAFVALRPSVLKCKAASIES